MNSSPLTLTLTILLSFITTTIASSASTLAIISSSSIVCALLATSQSIECSQFTTSNTTSQPFGLLPNTTFESISGALTNLVGLKTGGFPFFAWNASSNSTNNNTIDLLRKRIYNGPDAITDLTAGQDHFAAMDSNRTHVLWWRQDTSFSSNVTGAFYSLSSGNEFSCAVNNSGDVSCWGSRGEAIQAAFANVNMTSIIAGDSHACGISVNGSVVCGGDNSSGQSTPPVDSPAFEFSALALGSNHTCGVRRVNRTVVCWGGPGGGVGRNYTPADDTGFEVLVAGGNLTCGVRTVDFAVLCWSTESVSPSVIQLPLPRILPGICTLDQSSCQCGPYPDSETLCSGSGVICDRCDPPVHQLSQTSSSSRISRGWLAFIIVGSIGGFVGICTIVFWVWFGICGKKKVHNSVQPTITSTPTTTTNGVSHGVVSSTNGGGGEPIGPRIFGSKSLSRSRIFRRQRSKMMIRQRSGPSSFKDRAEQFIFAELAAATKDFSLENKIGAGSFGTVYKGKLADGREVAIKRSEPGPKAKKFQEKESAFQSELAFLSRLHHKHLVALVGYCEEKEERLLVYEYMKNGSLHHHLHSIDYQDSLIRNSWKMRIKALLDAARGIEYLHIYAVPHIIHRDIKSSNILLDANWVAKVSDFGLSLMGPESESGHLSMRAAGTVGYMDPEYYGLHHLTAKSDVYGLGVVMLEVLTGKRAIFKGDDGNPTSVVDYAVPFIEAGEIDKLIDSRLGMPELNEAEAVELVAYTAIHCVRLEGRDRPSMTDIVANLEGAMAMCQESHGSISSAGLSFASVGRD